MPVYNKDYRTTAELNLMIRKSWSWTENISDWYHTFWELYDHRSVLFIALCRALRHICLEYQDKQYSMKWSDFALWMSKLAKMYKSKIHFDWTEIEWRFIIQLYTPWFHQKQISYHLPNKYRDKCSFIETVEKANEWDWHTSNDVLDRLLEINF